MPRIMVGLDRVGSVGDEWIGTAARLRGAAVRRFNCSYCAGVMPNIRNVPTDTDQQKNKTMPSRGCRKGQPVLWSDRVGMCTPSEKLSRRVRAGRVRSLHVRNEVDVSHLVFSRQAFGIQTAWALVACTRRSRFSCDWHAVRQNSSQVLSGVPVERKAELELLAPRR